MMTSLRRTGLVRMAFLGALVLVGCDSLGPEEPAGPGALFVDLQSPYGAEGAAVFEIEEVAGLGEITSMGGWVFREETGEGIRVVVILTTPGPIHFQIRVDEVGRLPDVSLIQVAGPENELREALEEYRVDLFQMADRGAR